MRFRVLGPLEVWDAGVQRDVGPGRERALLALLVLHRDEALSVDQIVDALWGSHPPTTAQTLVHDYVSQLRELLGAETLVSHPWGYGLRVPRGGVDADEFERLVDRAREEEPDKAVETLHEALALWRGPALVDVADAPFAQGEIARLEETRRAAQAQAFDVPLRRREFVDESATDPGPEPAATSPRWAPLSSATPQRWRIVAGGAAFIAAATIAVVWGVTRGDSRHVVIGPNMVAALDPDTNRLVDAFSVGSVPTQLAIGGKAVWILNSNDRTVSRVEPGTRSVRTVSTGTDVAGIAVASDSAWVANGLAGTVSRIDVRSAEVLRTIKLPRGREITSIAADPSDVWVTGNPGVRPALAWRIDPHTNEVTRTVTLDDRPRAVAIVGSSVWIRGDFGIVRLDRRTGRVQHRLALPSHGCCEWGGLAVGGRSLWVVGIARAVLWRLDAGAGRLVSAIPLRGQHPVNLMISIAHNGAAVGAHAVWVADANGAILKVNPQTNRVVAQIPVDGVPRGLAFGFGRLWIALG